MKALLATLGLVLVMTAACSKKDDAPSQPSGDAGDAGPKTSTLAIDIRGSIDVTMQITGDTLTVDLVGRDMDFAGFFSAEEKLHAVGRVEKFPESNLTLYTGLISLPARPASPCGAQPMSIALSLSQRGTNTRVAGGLTVYCADRAIGVPKRVFRISGSL